MKKNHRKLAKFILAATATSTIASFGVGYLLTAFSLKNKGYLADKYWKKEPVDINTLPPELLNILSKRIIYHQWTE